MSYTLEEAAGLYKRAQELGLGGAHLLADPALVCAQCNGVGADWMPTQMRKLCTMLNPVMEIPAAIHDRRYAIGGVEWERLVADASFLESTLKIIEAEYAWYNPFRYLMRRRAMRYYNYLRAFGGAAWNSTGEIDALQP